ncbi:site-specific integrase [Devosia sp. MC532]|uniref:site-specific integrase n=1 Tax=Devosia sp. MC532 TaxID=2799788 RepID=UPI0018F6C0D3|nr:site-specific integrase [Devosia sp. MC532]MBJ7577465.1 site-specific integrase [Devosia sp. MC532]
MSDMPKHPRLIKRGTTYYVRAAVPLDIKATYPKSEEKVSLGTGNHSEAVVLARKISREIDLRFEAHRRNLEVKSTAPVQALTDAQLLAVEEAYFRHLLEEDDEVRDTGFYELDEPLPKTPVQSFDEYAEEFGEFADVARHLYARGKVESFYRDEAEEVLSWTELGINLAPDSPSWKPAVRAILAAIVRAQGVVEARNRGDVVRTAEVAKRPSVGIAASVAVASGAGPLASVVRKAWIEEKSRSAWVEKTRREHEVWSAHFLSLVGDRPIGDYSKSDGRAFKQALQRLPPNWSKHSALASLGFASASEKASELGLPPMSDRNINKVIMFLGSFWNWAAENYDEAKGNPFDKLKLKIKASARDERDPFTIAQLNGIFRAPIYTGCVSNRFWARAGSEVLSDSGKYWVPLISLYSGARLGEIIQLRTADVQEAQGVLHFVLVDEHEDQRLKTANAQRLIPVHPELVKMGLARLVERRRRVKQERLFPDLPMGEDGYYSSPFSKFFTRFLVTCDVKTAKTSFHSFRHNFEDACRDAEMPTEIMNTLQGHSEKAMAARYGKGYVLPKLDEWVRRIEYKGLDLSHLKSC